MTRIEYVPDVPEYGEFRDPGWYVVGDDSHSEGPFRSRREAETAAGRPDDDG
jgi:hypothetical protein